MNAPKQVRIVPTAVPIDDSEVVSTVSQHTYANTFEPLTKADQYYDFACELNPQESTKRRTNHKHHKYIQELYRTLEGTFKGQPPPPENEPR